MIISHRYRFIFIKTEKTAGTSIELALSALCGPDDVITPVSPEDERFRGQRGPQNYQLHQTSVLKRLLGIRSVYNISSHVGASEIVRLFGKDLWNQYFKFCFERNPWDRQVSMFHFLQARRNRYKSFDHFLQKRRSIIKNYERYSLGGQVAADFIGKFENLLPDLHQALRQIGISETIHLEKAKSGYRPPVHYRAYYSEKTRDLIGHRYRREIELLGYEF